MTVRVQEADFDIGAEIAALTDANKRIGGLAVFVGLVREMHVREGLHRDRIDALTLEHYPGMTEQALEAIEAEAKLRWPLEATLIVHRYGRLEAGARIVLVAVGSPHREAAFEACEFLVDWLKTKAPFWKLEETPPARSGSARIKRTTRQRRAGRRSSPESPSSPIIWARCPKGGGGPVEALRPVPLRPTGPPPPYDGGGILRPSRPPVGCAAGAPQRRLRRCRRRRA